MKITQELKEAKDKNSHFLDFLFCSKCVQFITISDQEIGDDVTCPNCRTDKCLL